MISKNKIKFINSLKLKKNRDINNLFIIEGTKIYFELINQKKYKLIDAYCTDTWVKKNNTNTDYNLVTDNELKKISNQKNPEGILAIVEKTEPKIDKHKILNSFSIVLDDIQDPGNLGTIIRTADWFGIENIFCSLNSVDVFNPKVIQATKGSIFRVNVFYVDLFEFLKEYNKKIKFYAAFLDGENIYKTKFDKKGILIFGNESKGISKKVSEFKIDKIKIPNFSNKKEKAESLNISISTAIFLSEILNN